jgi:hypothetical protein
MQSTSSWRFGNNSFSFNSWKIQLGDRCDQWFLCFLIDKTQSISWKWVLRRRWIPKESPNRNNQ